MLFMLSIARYRSLAGSLASLSRLIISAFSLPQLSFRYCILFLGTALAHFGIFLDWGGGARCDMVFAVLVFERA